MINKDWIMSRIHKSNSIIIGLMLASATMCVSGCATLLYGYKKVNTVDRKWFDELAAEFGVETENVLYLDSIEVIGLRELLCNSNATIQPMQMHYVMGYSMVSSYYNCYAKGGLRNIHWRLEDPGHRLTEGDCVFTNSQMNKHLRDLVRNQTEDILIVGVTSMFKRQSEDLVRIGVTRSSGLTLILANIDSYYLGVN